MPISLEQLHWRYIEDNWRNVTETPSTLKDRVRAKNSDDCLENQTPIIIMEQRSDDA